jgi:biopolymer transport protein ExbB/TolQ
VSRINRLALAVVRSALLWGTLGSLGFYTLIHTGTLKGEFFDRYFAGHWVNYTETILFFFGLALLILRSCDLADQRFLLKKKSFELGLPVPDAAAESRALLEHVDKLPAGEQQHYFPRRLREALDGVMRNGSADSLENDLRYLSDMDGGRAHAGYAMVRLIIWAIPILGFLGTVIGITMAIAALDPKALEHSMNTVTAGLGVAFDTTALALGLSMVLMFLQYFVDKQEQRLLGEIDVRILDLLAPRFPTAGSTDDPDMRAVRRMADAVIGNVERCVSRQAELWKESMAVADQHWKEVAAVGSAQLEDAFARAITKSMDLHRKHLLAAEDAASEQNRKHWAGVQQALEACTATAREQQAELASQAQALVRVVEATGHVRSLEESLNRNMAALTASQNLQETLISLSAAVSLLSARLERVGTPTAHLGVHTNPASKAA